MKNEKETRQNLLKSAKQEFLEKGFLQASLRNICKNAGVTTGALYFFFQDKEDLFAALVQEPLDTLFQVMREHYESEIHLPATFFEQLHLNDFSDDIETARKLVHFMYHYYDEFQLLLVKSQGSRFETCIDQFVAASEKHYRILADRVSAGKHTERIDDYMIHWVAHMQIDAFVHLLTHEKSEAEAVKHIESMVYYIIDGWLNMFERQK